MGLVISDKGLAIIKKYEGCHLQAYKCPAGIWTIGYGHTAGVQEGQVITQEQAEAYLRADCSGAERAVNSYMDRYGWNQSQFDALVSFTFNCGAGTLKNLLKSGQRSISEISVGILAYDKATVDGQPKALPGLTKRRAEEKGLFDAQGGGGSPAGSPYVVGQSYTLCADKVRVRTGPGTGNAAKSYAQLTTGAQSCAYPDGTLKKGTKVTCKAVQNVDGDTWIQIPSGWIAGCYKGKKYVS